MDRQHQDSKLAPLNYFFLILSFSASFVTFATEKLLQCRIWRDEAKASAAFMDQYCLLIMTWRVLATHSFSFSGLRMSLNRLVCSDYCLSNFFLIPGYLDFLHLKTFRLLLRSLVSTQLLSSPHHCQGSSHYLLTSCHSFAREVFSTP